MQQQQQQQQQRQQRQRQRQRQRTRRQGDRDGSIKINASSSAPLLHRDTDPALTSSDAHIEDVASSAVGILTDNSLFEEREEKGRLFKRRTPSKSSATRSFDHKSGEEDASEDGDAGTKSSVEVQHATRCQRQLESRNQDVESRCRNLEHRCTQLEAELSSTTAELKSYKAEVRAKTMAVGKAEVILNEVCLLMARRLGCAEGVQISDNKGGVLREVHQAPAEFAAQIKKNILAQLSKWEIDRAALRAVVERAGDDAADTAKVHEAKQADLSARAELLEERIRKMELESQRQVAKAEAVAERSREECQAASSVKDKLNSQLETATARNKELCQHIQENEKHFQAQLDRFLEYPKAAERMAEELDKCQRSARRERNLMSLERKDFRRQLHTFQKWQTDNKLLRDKVKLLEIQGLTLRRQLAATEAGVAGSDSTRKAVIGGTVDRLQRAETTAKHQAKKYRDLAGVRGVQVAQLQTEVASLKATNKNLRRMLEPPSHDSYETEIARFAQANPKILEIQRKSGLNEEDMHASIAQLKLLREKEEQKDALIALARERDEFELCIKELRARNSWLEKQVLATPQEFRSVTHERVSAVAQSEAAELFKRPETVANAGRAGVQINKSKGDYNCPAPPGTSDPVSRLEYLFNKQRGRGGAGAAELGSAMMDSTARIRRNIKFLEDCDRSIERQREREAAITQSAHVRKDGAGGGSGVAAVHAVKEKARQRPQSAQGLIRRPSSSCPRGGDDASFREGLFRRGGGRPVSAGRAWNERGSVQIGVRAARLL